VPTLTVFRRLSSLHVGYVRRRRCLRAPNLVRHLTTLTTPLTTHVIALNRVTELLITAAASGVYAPDPGLYDSETLCSSTISYRSTALYFYEYLITLDQEINHIWAKRWSFSTLIFAINRYATLGLAFWGLLGTPSYTVSISLLVRASDMLIGYHFGQRCELSFRQICFWSESFD
jgi:hypothetical protein